MDFTKRAFERRSKVRFAIERDVRYKIAKDGVVVAVGSGQTINMSSGGVAFVAEKPVTPGGLVELSISWPMLLHETCPIRLIVFGRILRCIRRKAVCSIDKYEYRTQSRGFQPSATTRAELQRWADGMRREGFKSNLARA